MFLVVYLSSMKAHFSKPHGKWRVIVPTRITGNDRRQFKFFETQEEAEAAIQLLPKIDRLQRLEIEAKIEPIIAAIEKLNPGERWNLMRRLLRSSARERREKSRANGEKIHPKDQPESTRLYQSNIQHKLRTCLSNRLRQLLRTGNARGKSSILKVIGCDIPWLVAWLEVHFKPGMNWENYGSVWHCDHRQPCAGFNLTDPQQQRLCFHWTNLQPLFAHENLSKGAKLIA
jgi:hypothetical protein